MTTEKPNALQLSMVGPSKPFDGDGLYLDVQPNSGLIGR